MIPLTAVSVSQPSNMWKTAVYAGVVTGIIALVMTFVAGAPIIGPILGLLIGAGPILGYDLARGALGANWRPVIAGIIGNILFIAGVFLPGEAFPVVAAVVAVLSTILWPIVVGAMVSEQSLGKLLLGSLLGLVLGLIVALVVASAMGQDPSQWPRIAGIVFWLIWGGTVGAIMSSWSRR